ncbi:metallophosphoesterase [Synechococcus sp. CBW1002]|uniref:metallophosphoesterase n=1 Tax=Synechococcus sp. CBW1002 TaxID=1353134 RepID=UPI001E47F225|nr:metallophosphoesterase [Synechococcus sp. CBW1002]
MAPFPRSLQGQLPRLRRRQLLRMLPSLGIAIAAAPWFIPRSGRSASQGPPTRLRVLAIADSGSGNANQQAVADRMAALHRREPVNLVLMGGDNIYPDGNIKLVQSTFERPYRALLQAGVPFHAVLGNHDIRTANGTPQLHYKPFGMAGRWYSLRRGPVEFFLLDTNGNADWNRQLPWLQSALSASKAPWKVVVGHHPIYSSGHYGDQPHLIHRLTPLFKRHGVQLYINGHEHNYERTKPIDGITYLTVGGAGAWLRPVKANARSARAASVYSFAELDFTPTQLELRAWDSKGQRIDQVQLTARP